MTIEQIIETQKFNDNEIIRLWDPPVALDGIIEPKCWINVAVKVLWILKEQNAGGSENEVFDHRQYFRECAGSNPSWKSTAGNIARVSYGILNKIYDPEKIPKIGIDQNEGFAVVGDHDIFCDLAIINVKKTAGGSVADGHRLVSDYAIEAHKKFILQQIDFIDPDIIINCHRDFARITIVLFRIEKIIRRMSLEGKSRIDAYHPQAQNMITTVLYSNFAVVNRWRWMTVTVHAADLPARAVDPQAAALSFNHINDRRLRPAD